MNGSEIIFDAVRPMLDAQGFNKPGRVDTLNDACLRFLAANGVSPVTNGQPTTGPGLGGAATGAAEPASDGTMRLGPKGAALIHSFEQCKLAAYPDPGSANGDPWTIGWGSTGPDIHRGITWTQAQADDRFKTDIVRYENAVKLAVGTAPTSQEQFDALVSLAYNIGIKAMSGSTVVRKHNAGDHAGAAAAFGMWVKNDGKVMRGLVRRRDAEAALYRGAA